MTKLTFDMLREAIDKIRNGPPHPVEIRVGSSIRFRKFIENTGQFILQEPKPYGSFAGITIIADSMAPDNLAIIMGSDGSMHVITLDEPKQSS